MGKSGNCPTCGRAEVYWNERAPGVKGRQRLDHEDRDKRYRAWRRTIGRQMLVMDVDQVEYRFRGGQIRPAALLELTRIDGDVDPPPSYFQRIWTRASERDPQVRVLRALAQSIGCDAYYVAYQEDGSAFYVADIKAEEPEWTRLSKRAYQCFLEVL